MPLESIRIPDFDVDASPPSGIAFIDDAVRRIDAFELAHATNPIRHFIPSNYRAVHSALHYLTREGLVTGRSFCEWGSGFGVVAGLAEIEGYEAIGIEIEPELVQASRRLLTDFDLSANVFEGSYLPSGFGLYYDAVGDSRQLVEDGNANPVYDDAGMDVADFDLVFVYPWPGEAQMIEDLFEATAVHGAILLLYQGHQDLAAYRQLAP